MFVFAVSIYLFTAICTFLFFFLSCRHTKGKHESRMCVCALVALGWWCKYFWSMVALWSNGLNRCRCRCRCLCYCWRKAKASLDLAMRECVHVCCAPFWLFEISRISFLFVRPLEIPLVAASKIAAHPHHCIWHSCCKKKVFELILLISFKEI